MFLGLALGLPLNLATGVLGPLSMGAGLQPGAGSTGLLVLATIGQIVGAPVLAAVGRMALTAYLLQSLLTLVLFACFDLYGRLTAAQGMLVVLGVWVVLVVLCPLWMRGFRFGPVEWLWRTLTYGQREPMRGSAT